MRPVVPHQNENKSDQRYRTSARKDGVTVGVKSRSKGLCCGVFEHRSDVETLEVEG